MELQLKRIKDTGFSTLGVLYINGIAICGIVEDEERDVKVKGETRIPNGRYEIKLRKVGGFHGRYTKRYNDKSSRLYRGENWHRGMLHIIDVPNFEYILIHTGNTEDHTMGCLLPNFGIDFKTGKGSRSNDAYVELYPQVLEALESGEKVFITVTDVEDGK